MNIDIVEPEMEVIEKRQNFLLRQPKPQENTTSTQFGSEMLKISARLSQIKRPQNKLKSYGKIM